MTSDNINQLYVDRFYAKHGKCCAGCDFWSWHNPVVGDCTKSAPVPGWQRMTLLGMKPSHSPDAGHLMTPREHVCGEFMDTFDWESLGPYYLKSIGMTVKREWQK